MALKGPRSRSDKAAAIREWKHTVISPALAHPKNSTERAAAIRQIAATPLYHPSKGPIPAPPERTVHRWIEEYEGIGFAVLAPKERIDKGERKAILTMRWDKAVSLPHDRKEEIAAETIQDIRNLWAGNASLIDVTRLASEHLAELTKRIGGFKGEDAELKAICRISRNVIERERKFRRAAQHRTDRKAYEDSRPRIRRSREGLAPMQLVIGDVHHSDVLVRRPDGTAATPKLISWLDVGTGRLRFDVVLCGLGKGVTNADLIRSFLNMVTDPAWGMPANLYLDNGSEYRFAEFIRDALKLAGLHCELCDGPSGLIKATAYNAAAKGLIERAFRAIEAIFATMPGYIGGNRMLSKSGNVGRAPTPYPGTFAEWSDQAQGLLGYYNTRKARGRQLSPSQAYHQAVLAGWQRVDADPDALRAAFSVEKTPKVSDGKISVNGVLFYADELFGFEGEKVTVLVPKYEQAGEVPVFGRDGRYICAAGPDRPEPYLSKSGAIEAGRRKQVAAKHIADLKTAVQPENVPARMIASSQAADPGTPQAPSAGIVSFSERAAAAGRVMRPKSKADRDRRHDAIQEEQRKRLEMLESHERAIEAARRDGRPE